MSEEYLPSYLKLSRRELKEKIKKAQKLLTDCTICPWKCRVNRPEGQLGHCRAPAEAVISSAGPHFGEEPQLVGFYGSGTIFFTHCNLDCIFCQNWEISHEGQGSPVSSEELATIMLELQNQKCHNINLVSPSPHVAAILASLPLAIDGGLKIPFVYNTGGYDSLETLTLLDGIIDIYMPDFKYWEDDAGRRCSGPRDYPQRVKEGLLEMQRQVGDLRTGSNNIAFRGLLIRHLVLPENLAGTEEVVRFLARNVSPRCAVNIMGQYYPAYRANNHPLLGRSPKPEEIREAKKKAVSEGLRLIR